MTPPFPPLSGAQVLRFREYCRIISRCWEGGADPDPLTVFEEMPELLASEESILSLLTTAREIERERGLSLRWAALAGQYPQLRGFVERVRTPAPDSSFSRPLLELPADLFRVGHRAIRSIGEWGGGADYLGVDSRDNGLRLLRVCRDQSPDPSAGPDGSHPGVIPFLETGRTADGLGWSVVPLCGSLTLAGVLQTLALEKRRPLRSGFLNDCVREALPAELGLLRFWQPQPILDRCSFADGVVWLGSQLAASLGFLHRQGYAYGRLRPENVLLSFAGQPMLVGHGWQSAADPRCSAGDDIFALGELLRELLGVNRPHKPGSSGFDLMLTPRLLRVLQLCESREIAAGELIDELPKCLSRGLRLQEWHEEDLCAEPGWEESPSHMG